MKNIKIGVRRMAKKKNKWFPQDLGDFKKWIRTSFTIC
jgi:hypothetical protein